MSLQKIGSSWKILKTAAAVEELLIDRPMEEKVPGSSHIIEPKNEQFLYLRARAISSYETNGANGNWDAFGWDDLLKSYASFQGKGLYIDHSADSVLKAVGRLIDSYPVEDPETGEKYIEVLAKLDKYLFPELARQVQTGILNTVSMGCFKEGTQILLSDHTFKNIEDIKVGDKVLNHLGLSDEVIETMIRPYDGLMYTLKLLGFTKLPITATNEHPFWSIKKENIINILNSVSLVEAGHSITGQSLEKIASNAKYFEWISAENLRPGDYVSFPFSKEEKTPDNITKEFARLLGWYLAEGNIIYYKCYPCRKVNKICRCNLVGGAMFTLHIKEAKYAKEIKTLISSITKKKVTIKKYPKLNACRIFIYDKELAEKLMQLGGEKAKTKKLDPSVLLWNIEFQKELLGAFLCGDGCYSDYEEINRKDAHPHIRRAYLETASQAFIYQMAWLFCRASLLFALEEKHYKEKIANFKSGTKTIAASRTYRICISGESLHEMAKYCDKIPTGLPVGGNKQQKLLVNNYLMIPISGIEVEDQKLLVYNFSVKEKNSYLVNGVAVHNCSVDESACSVCGLVLHSDADPRCKHLEAFSLGHEFDAEVDNLKYNISKGQKVKAMSLNSGIAFNELSLVGIPADPKAIVKTILSNMRSRLSKTAALSKDEQQDFVKQFEGLLTKVDSETAKNLKAEFCGICPTTDKEAQESSKESSMSDKNIVSEDQKKILSKISALEMEQLESYIQHKTKKANEVVNKEVVADATKKEETFLSRIVAKVKDSFAAQLLEKKVEAVAKEELGKETAKTEFVKCPNCDSVAARKVGDEVTCVTCDYGKKKDKKSSISAKFNEDKNNVLASTWSVYEDAKCLLDASLKDIWGSTFETLSFDDQKWATSEAYGKEVVARYTKEGIEKLADLWDVTHKLNKTAKGPELGPDGSYAKPSTGTNNKEHNVKNSPVTKPGQEQAQKGPAAPAGTDAKTDPQFKMPGQEKGQTGPAAPKAKEVKTDYSEPKPEAEGKEVTTTPKNPEEKKLEKSEKEVETSYVAKGTEEMEAEEKGSKKEAATKCPECGEMLEYGRHSMNGKPCKLVDEKKASVNYKEANAQIKWSSMTPEAQEFIKKHVEKHIKEDGMERAQAVAAAYSEAREKGMDVPKKSSQETIMEKKAADKPTEAVDGSTLPEGTKKFDAKPDESVKGTTLPEEGKSATPETSVDGDKVNKTPNLTKEPDQAVKDKKEPSSNPSSKPDEAVKGKTEHTTPNLTKEPDVAVNKSAATEMPPTPEHADPLVDDVKVEEKPAGVPEHETENLALPGDTPKEEVSAFDKADKLDIGEGYSAHKDKESKEVIIEKDGKEVKRLPDGFGKEVGEVLKLMKAVLGLPPVEEKKPEMAPAMPEAPKMEEAPKVEEHPALEEAHEDEMGMKESALKTREEAISKKEAELKAIEVKAQEEEKAKKFAAILSARSERCQKIVANMVDKNVLQLSPDVLDSELKSGTYLLDARHKAMTHAIKAKHKELLAFDDMALKAMEKAIEELPMPSSTVNEKKATRVPYLTYDPSDHDEVGNIFRSMGTLKHKTINDVPKK
jgi:hypothetical protein